MKLQCRAVMKKQKKHNPLGYAKNLFSVNEMKTGMSAFDPYNQCYCIIKNKTNPNDTQVLI